MDHFEIFVPSWSYFFLNFEAKKLIDGFRQTSVKKMLDNYWVCV